MKFWLVGVSDCESNSTVCICSTKEIAVRELFKVRDRLISKWRQQLEQEKSTEYMSMIKKMYLPMIENLSGDDYDKWENYPHDVPYIYETEVVTK